MLRLICVTILAWFSVAATAINNQPTLKFALIAPFSGPYAAYGTQLLSGATQAANDINKSGSLKDVQIDIVPIDDQCNPVHAVAAAENIIAEKEFTAVIGHACSAATLATSSIYAKANMLVITPTSTYPSITERKIATLFRISGNDIQQSATAANFIAHKLHSKRVAIIHDQDIFSKGLADLVSEKLVRLDTTPILYQAVPRGTKNFTALGKKLKKLDADAVYFAGLYPEVGALAQALKLLELQIPVITADGVALQKFVHGVGGPKIASTVLMTFGANANNLVSSKSAIHSMQNNHLETEGYALYAYAAVQVLEQALRAANNTDGALLAAWLHQHEVDTVLGKKSWDTNGDIIDHQFKIYAWNSENKLESISQ